MKFKIAIVHVPETVQAFGNTLYPGTYPVHCPLFYVEEEITGEDILCDGLIFHAKEEEWPDWVWYALYGPKWHEYKGEPQLY